VDGGYAWKGTAKFAADRLVEAGQDGQAGGIATPARSRNISHRFPPEVISHAVWLYFRFPLSLRMAEEMLAVRDVVVRQAPP
jgi:hypothetical protein